MDCALHSGRAHPLTNESDPMTSWQFEKHPLIDPYSPRRVDRDLWKAWIGAWLKVVRRTQPVPECSTVGICVRELRLAHNLPAHALAPLSLRITIGSSAREWPLLSWPAPGHSGRLPRPQFSLPDEDPFGSGNGQIVEAPCHWQTSRQMELVTIEEEGPGGITAPVEQFPPLSVRAHLVTGWDDGVAPSGVARRDHSPADDYDVGEDFELKLELASGGLELQVEVEYSLTCVLRRRAILSADTIARLIAGIHPAREDIGGVEVFEAADLLARFVGHRIEQISTRDVVVLGHDPAGLVRWLERLAERS